RRLEIRKDSTFSSVISCLGPGCRYQILFPVGAPSRDLFSGGGSQRLIRLCCVANARPIGVRCSISRSQIVSQIAQQTETFHYAVIVDCAREPLRSHRWHPPDARPWPLHWQCFPS